MLNPADLGQLTAFRHELHQNPELSGEETATADRVEQYLKAIDATVQIRRAGRGLLAVFDSGKTGPITMIRAELDALPIQEVNDIPYRSQVDGMSHKCGHDGHMCMVAGLAYLLKEQPVKKGKVLLLFQSAEETGQGARWMREDAKFQAIKPDYAFSLHNLPGYPMHEILLKEGTFCAASTGLKITLTGKTAHASHPETGISPAGALARLATQLVAIPQQASFDDFTLVSLTHMQLGEPTFGVNPGQAEIWLTIRAYLDQDLEKLKTDIRHMVEAVAAEEQLSTDYSYHEGFEATVNRGEEVLWMQNVAEAADLNFQYLDQPNRWSEDFGLFLQQSKGAMFGLGSGVDQPALHNPDYDFPDELIATGVKMFWGLILKINY